MAQELRVWRDAVQTKRFETDSSLCPVSYFSKAAMPVAALDAISNKELAEGWPSAIVLRCTQRRSARADLQVSPRGFSVHKPSLELYAEGLADSIRSFFRKWSISDIPKRVGEIPGNAGTISDAVLGEYGARKWGSTSAAVDTIVAFMDSPTVLSYSEFTGRPITKMPSIPGEIVSLLADEYFVYAYAEYLDVTTRAAVARGVRLKIRRKSAGDMLGVKALFVYGAGANYAFVGDPNKAVGWRQGAIFADDGATAVLNACKVPFDFVKAGPVDTTAGYGNGGSSFYAAKWRCDVHEIVDVGLPTTGGPWQTVQSGFNTRHGVSIDSVTHIGDAEFVDRSLVLGNLAVDPVSGVVSVSGATWVFDWDGARMGDASPNATEAQKAELAKLYITTVVLPQVDSESFTLADLAIERLSRDNNDTIAGEEMVKADPTHGTAALTFGQVFDRVSQLDRRIYHRVLFGEDVFSTPHKVVIAGVQDDSTVAAFDSDGVNLGWSTDECMLAVADGVYVEITYTGVDDPYLSAFGYTLTQIQQGTPASAAKAELNEALMFGQGTPVLSRLTKGKRLGLWMLQAAMNRKQFSSYVIGGCSMASVARKRL